MLILLILPVPGRAGHTPDLRGAFNGLISLPLCVHPPCFLLCFHLAVETERGVVVGSSPEGKELDGIAGSAAVARPQKQR